MERSRPRRTPLADLELSTEGHLAAARVALVAGLGPHEFPPLLPWSPSGLEQHVAAAAARTHARPTEPSPTKLPGPAVTPSRACMLCCETDVSFIRPCSCPHDWCHNCLRTTFIEALKDTTMFPARCCSFIQLYTALPLLTIDQAEQYRDRFEEWISPTKTYCPSPSCSAFIPDRTLEKAKLTVPNTLRAFLENILTEVNNSQYARFFREEPDITQVPGHTSVVATPIYLTEMQAKLDRYTCTEELTDDVRLIVSNANLHGSDHPIAKAARGLFDLYLHELSESIGKLVAGNTSSLTCPTCWIGICGDCKKLDHRGHACDTSDHDAELAMLAKFGYKQCPRCGHGVRKMFGCSHIVCRCGAGWCWNCTRSIELCPGDCGAEEEGEDDDEDEDDEIDYARVIDASEVQPQSQSLIQTEPRNLDARRYWEQQNPDFGEEPPEDNGQSQVWSCEHSWMKYRPVRDGFFHGDPQLIECNRCFKSCPSGKGASKCLLCLLLVCSGCKDSYKSKQAVN